MYRCLEIAAHGLGRTAPNPLVGCVIVKDNQIIGEGFHREFGKAHAEVNAIRSVKDPELLKEATLYVNLEPCSHHGKTPPCADLIISSQIPRVVVANEDPNELVAGKGIQKLRDADVQVTTGILREQGEWLNRRFFTFHRLQRPYIILKWAQTEDGFIAPPASHHEEGVFWISGIPSRKIVHQWRAEEMGVLVGKTTVRQDNPQLTVREVKGKNPTRIVLAGNGDIPETARVLDQEAETLFYTYKKGVHKDAVLLQSETDNLPFVLKDLHQRQIQSVLVEGGHAVLSQFIEHDLWDEARIFYAPHRIKQGVRAPFISGNETGRHQIGSDTLVILRNE